MGREALRLVHGEADVLPGPLRGPLRDGLVLQTLSEGMDARKEGLAAMLEELTGATQWSAATMAPAGTSRGCRASPACSAARDSRGATYHEGDNGFQMDLLGDMKTGAFLDQVDNHLRAGELGRGRALDGFSYHGGFALALAARATPCWRWSRTPRRPRALEENARRNGRRNVKVREANAFDVLHQLDRDGERFDTVVLDPPGLAKRKEGLRTAMRAYHELNLRALRCLRPGGLLDHLLLLGEAGAPDFEEMLLGAADDVRRPIQILERRGPAADHPVLGGLPETEYLKAFFVRAL